jgi:hypothetical protein
MPVAGTDALTRAPSHIEKRLAKIQNHGLEANRWREPVVELTAFAPSHPERD